MNNKVKDSVDKAIDRSISTTVGKLYVLAVEKGFDLNSFSDLFLTSDFCARAFDIPYSHFQMDDEDVSMIFLLREVAPKVNESDQQCAEDAAYWIGYMYRFLYIQTDIPSAVLKEKVSFSYMLKKFYGLSTIDEEQAVDIICSDCHLEIEALNEIEEDYGNSER